jgi:hypothetical protein
VENLAAVVGASRGRFAIEIEIESETREEPRENEVAARGRAIAHPIRSDRAFRRTGAAGRCGDL